MFRSSGDVRKPSVAGSFYPGSRGELESMVDDLLAGAEPPEQAGDVLAIVVPHAGYVYSGETAAVGYSALSGEYEAVVILAPSHREAFSGVSIKTSGAYETPLGKAAIHEDIARRILKHDPDVQETHQGHGAEHAIEVQVPFIQRALGGRADCPAGHGGALVAGVPSSGRCAGRRGEAASHSCRRVQ